MTRILVRMTAHLLRLPTRLLARLSTSVLALSNTMTSLATEVGTALELPPADLAATNVLKPTLLIFHRLLAAHAPPLDQERALGARLAVLVAVVLNLWMSAGLGTIALEATWRGLSTARKGRLEDCPSAATGEFFEDRFAARATRTLVTELLTLVVATF